MTAYNGVVFIYDYRIGEIELIQGSVEIMPLLITGFAWIILRRDKVADLSFV